MAKMIDATLREGNQSPNVHFSIEQSVTIARYLKILGIEMIEIGHPFSLPFEMERVQKVVEAIGSKKILSHARALESDVLAVAKSGAEWVGIFAGVNEYSQKYRFNGKTRTQILERIRNSVSFAKQLKLGVRYTVEDASRTSNDFLFEAYETALSAAADRICFADTVGVLEPKEAFEKIYAIKKRFHGVELEVHFHDDRGLAISNSLTAIDAGADWISCSVNGLGERCGITDTCAMMVNLFYREGRDFSLFPELCHLSRLVTKISDSPPDARRPVIGKYALTHTAKLHRDAMGRNPLTYTWMKELAHFTEAV